MTRMLCVIVHVIIVWQVVIASDSCRLHLQSTKQFVSSLSLIQEVDASSKVQCYLRCSKRPRCSVPQWDESDRKCLLMEHATAEGTKQGQHAVDVLAPVRPAPKNARLESTLCGRQCYGEDRVVLHYLSCQESARSWWNFDKSIAAYPHSRFPTEFTNTFNSLTGCAWVQENGGSDLGAIIFMYAEPTSDNLCNDFAILIDTTLTIWIHNEVATAELGSLRDGTPHHICLRWKKKQGEWGLFQDGELIGQGDQIHKGGVLTARGHVYIGRDADILTGTCHVAFTEKAFVGKVAALQFWEAYLSQAQIRANYKSCQTDFEGLKFKLGSVTPAEDTSRKEPFCAAYN